MKTAYSLYENDFSLYLYARLLYFINFLACEL